MSGYARPVLASRGRLDPNVALVKKPFSETDLLAMAGQVLDGHFPRFSTTGGVPERSSLGVRSSTIRIRIAPWR